MNLDRLCFLFVLSLLPLLWLPFDWLPYAFVLTGCFVLVAIWRKSGLWLLLAVLQGVSLLPFFATVNSADQVKAERVQEPLKIIKILKQGEYQTAIGERQTGERIYLNWQAKTPLQLERTYNANFTVRQISSRLNDGNFSRQKWYFANHIDQIGTVRTAQAVDFTAYSARTNWLERVREQTAELRSQGLLLALGFGERAWLRADDWQHFQRTSTAHLIAISGLHIALAFGFGLWLGKGVQWLGWQLNRTLSPACGRETDLSKAASLRKSERGRTSGGFQSIFYKFKLVARSCKWARVLFTPIFPQLIGLAFAIGYSYLAGFAVPTLRALVAIGLILACQFLRRHLTPWQFWWRAVALLLLLDPISLLSDSFWLSILAVASLIFWYRVFPLKQFVPENGKKIVQSHPLFFGLVHLQFGILLIFSPVQLAFFDGISPLAFVANLLIVPLYSLLLVPLILFSLLTDNLLQTWQLADWLVQGSLWAIEPMAAFWIDLSHEKQWHLLSLNLLILLGIFCWQRKPKRWWAICLLPLIFNRLYFVPDLFSPPPTAQWIHFDVGQGLAMALVYREQGERKAVLYDTGASWQGGSMAEIEIIPYLKRQGIDLQAIFISHSDNDHSGGLPSLQKAFPAARLITSQQGWGESCEKGKQWQFGGFRLSAIFPEKAAKRAENEHSCVLLVEIGKQRLLLTGDSGVKQEQQFAQQLGKIDFLQVGHHGSKTSTSHTLLAHTQPHTAIISAGRWNPWKLPNTQIEERLKQYNVTFFNTAKVGMVQVNFYPTSYQIKTTRNEISPWYQSIFGD